MAEPARTEKTERCSDGHPNVLLVCPKCEQFLLVRPEVLTHGRQGLALVVSAVSGIIGQQGRPFTHAFEIHLERATLHYDFAAFADNAELMPLKILTEDGRVVRPDLGDGDPVRAFEAEIAEVAASLERGLASDLLSAALARDAIVLCQRQGESARIGRAVEV